jgi:hypothetical protein
VLEGTGTIWVYNKLMGDRMITSLYFTNADGSGTQNVLADPLRSGEVHYERGVKFGETTIEAVIEGGERAVQIVLVEDEIIYYVWITNDDIVS